MKNFVQRGEVLSYVVPSATTIAPGAGVKVGLIFGVAQNGGTTGQTVTLALEGVFSLPKATGVVNQGAALYWNDTTKVLTTTAAGNLPVGVAWAGATSGAATALVRLGGVPEIAPE